MKRIRITDGNGTRCSYIPADKFAEYQAFFAAKGGTVELVPEVEPVLYIPEDEQRAVRGSIEHERNAYIRRCPDCGHEMTVEQDGNAYCEYCE
jgi:hypothetical protein